MASSGMYYGLMMLITDLIFMFALLWIKKFCLLKCLFLTEYPDALFELPLHRTTQNLLNLLTLWNILTSFNLIVPFLKIVNIILPLFGHWR